MRGVANVGAGVERWEDPLHHHVLGRCDCHQTLEIVHRSRKSPAALIIRTQAQNSKTVY
jgi:hypothetical protein